MADRLKVLFFDIETSPSLAYIWSQRPDYVPHGQLVQQSFMLSWAARWEGQTRIRSQVLTPQEAKDNDDSRIVLGLADLIRQADLAVAHNADKFDVPVVNARLLNLGLEPLGPVRSIDTLKLARATFKLFSNRLDHLAQVLGVPTKMDTDFDLWRRCLLGDRGALTYMQRYNRHDVEVLEQVYQRMKPYVKGLPRLVDGSERDEFVCPSCGSDFVHRRGFARTNASVFRRFQCQESTCLRWFRARTSEPEKRLSTVPL